MSLGKSVTSHRSTSLHSALTTVYIIKLSGILFRQHLVHLIQHLGHQEEYQGHFNVWKDSALLNVLPGHETVKSIYRDDKSDSIGWK